MKNTVDEKDLISDYLNGLGTEKLSSKYHIGKLKVRGILTDNGVERKKRGGQKTLPEIVLDESYGQPYEHHDGYHYIAVAKDNPEVISKDYLNQSGALTVYIRDVLGEKIPNDSHKKIHYMEHKSYWYEEYFTITEVKNSEVKKCPYCNWETVDVDNKSGWFASHLLKEHNIKPEEHLAKYPGDKKYFPKYFAGLERQEHLSKEGNFVVCPICNEKFGTLSNTHIKIKHNMTVGQFKTLYPTVPVMPENLIDYENSAFRKHNDNVRITLKEAQDRFNVAVEKFGLEHIEPIWSTYTAPSITMSFICHRKSKDGTEHGLFTTRLERILTFGTCCSKCGNEKTIIDINVIRNDFKNRSDIPPTIEIDWSTYRNKNNNIRIICHKALSNGKEHGESIIPVNALYKGKHLCPICAKTTSDPENIIYQFLEELVGSDNIIKRNREILEGKEIDIFLPKLNIGIEYNGLYWHSAHFKHQNYHRDKMLLANQKGVRLIQIFEDEWLEHQEIVLNRLRHLVNGDVSKSTIGGRKCNIRQINNEIAKAFLDQYHIQGYVSSSIYLGAYYKDELVGVMTFIKEQSKMWILPRFATKPEYKLPGLANKMFKHFLNHFECKEVKSFLDLRWNQGLNNNTVYDKLGFKLNETLPPDYRYIVENERKHKFGFRKNILHSKYGLPLTMTEKEMCDELGFIRIYDCGLAKYVYRNEN